MATMSTPTKLEMTHNNTPRIARHWDAGEAGCGALILGLKREIDRIDSGELLQVTATDPAAIIDLAAWCEMTGNTLVTEYAPIYVVRRNNY
jgi:TusA-related sulfurtransferase